MERQRWTVFLLWSALALGSAMPAEAQSTGRVRYVTDGDTFRLTTGERIRIADVDAPETQRGRGRCAAEIRRGLAASAKVRALLSGRSVTFVRTGRSYNRTVARVRLDGRDLGETLIAQGVVRPWPRRRPKPNWCR